MMGRHRFNALLDVQLSNRHAPAGPAQSSFSFIPPLTLSSRTYLAPVQPQKQNPRDQTIALAVGSKIPGFKTSAAFFASLRTNLRLHASPPPSPMSTPPSMRGSAHSLAPPSPLAGPSDSASDQPDPVPEDPLAGVPDLESYVATDETETVAALKLVADSVAQMRQSASSALIVHPLNLSVWALVIAIVGQWFYKVPSDLAIIATTGAGITMALLLSVRWATSQYIDFAEEINWEWLGDADVLVTKFGDEVVGCLVLTWVSGEGRQKRKKAWRAKIKSWTVRLKYRGKGVGTALLEHAVKEARRKGAEGVEFADDHANSRRILPALYNSRFARRERKARDLLRDLLEASPCNGKKKKGSM